MSRCSLKTYDLAIKITGQAQAANPDELFTGLKTTAIGVEGEFTIKATVEADDLEDLKKKLDVQTIVDGLEQFDIDVKRVKITVYSQGGQRLFELDHQP